jgi:hypothetical protein
MERLERFGHVQAAEAARSGCLACHRNIAVINSKMAFIRDIDGPGKGCVVCHEGDAGATTMAEAHCGLIRNPGDLWQCSAGRGCAKCHSREASIFSAVSTASDPIGQRFHVYRVERSLMSTQMGILNNALCANGLQAIGERPYANFDCDDPLGASPLSGTETYSQWIAEAIRAQRIDRRPRVKALPTSEEARQKWGLPKAMIVDYYRKECARCHNWVDGAIWRGDRHGAGCSSCHVPYSNDAYYEGTDDTLSRDEIRKPLRHTITNAIESIQCTRCHTRGKRIGVSYLGMMEFPFKSPWRENGLGQAKLHNKRYIYVGCDVHLSKGIECVDCHTSIDVHGDGNIYPTTDHAVEIECTDCHGTAQAYPWELPVGYGDALVLHPQEPRGIYQDAGNQYILSARGNPIGNVVRKNNLGELRDMKGGLHPLPFLKTMNQDPKWNADLPGVAMARIPHTDTMECYACHAPWTAQCYGCHLKVDYSGRTTGGTKLQKDWLLSSKRRDRRGNSIAVLTPGVIEETRSFERWERPLLVINKDNRIAPGTPGCQVLATCIDEKGDLVTLNQHFVSSQGLPGLAINPAQPHTTSRAARSCESCHLDPKSMGYGLDGGRFAKLNSYIPGDLSDVKKTVPQICATSFQYDPTVLISKSGEQTQTMTYNAPVGPLKEEDRKTMDRRNVCLACHRHYGTAAWSDLRRRVGQVGSPGEHSQMLDHLLLGKGEKR